MYKKKYIFNTQYNKKMVKETEEYGDKCRKYMQLC
jgi:hypothetical protein